MNQISEVLQDKLRQNGIPQDILNNIIRPYGDIFKDLKVAYTADKSTKNQGLVLDDYVLNANALAVAFANSTGSVRNGTTCTFVDEVNNPVYEIKDIKGVISLQGYVRSDADTTLMFPVSSTATVFVHPGGIMSGMGVIEFNITSTADWTPRF
ncbi:MAG: hypothetical protein RR233_08925 [Clostridiales bacterium]